MFSFLCAAGVVAALLHQPWRPVVPFLCWGYGGALVGFVIANLLVNAVGLAILFTLGGEEGVGVVGVVALAVLFVGPFVASLVGTGFGGLLGVARVIRKGR